MMTFLSPFWLSGLVAVVLYLWIGRRKGWNKQGWLIFSIALLIVSLARPVLPQKPISVEEAGSDVILAVDLSYSMRGTDLAPSRLEVAKKILHEVVHTDQRDRFGVIGFTTSAIVLSPLTKDTELLEHLFGSLDESQIITKGTDVMSALELARKMSHSVRPNVILLTDGGDETSYSKEADFVRENNLAVSVVMLASNDGSTLPTADGSSLKDDAGHIVVSSRNDAIEEIVHKGKMIRGSDAGAILSLIDDARQNDFAGKSSVMRYQELFYIPLVLALITFIAAFTTIGRKFTTRFIPILALIGVSAQGGMLDFGYAYLAERNYQQGHFERSAELYRHIEGDRARYNRANALYKAGKYADALGIYHSIRTDNASFKANTFYNMGNCQIRLQKFAEAREAFLKSLTLRYTKAADQNLRAVEGVKEQQTLNVRKEKKDTFSAEENKPTGEKKSSKEGGGSNMKTDTASGGGGDEGKKVQSDPRFSMSQGKAKLSSRQYELINQRSVHETKPW
ncbi:MAG: VWA domain-containing protein [Sulfuricurvum sp.]|uniref:VWA domain-containing protein n=1 Tax=Sulfuricurvum sp. TaxID=2025608 RepID=UPI00261B0D80|nr:VWA domain-containing protein [Sulfuricurvum sp.]MDD5160998.1 VWA domain-containing protein [Sulfuricurvum sp.]